MITSEELRIWAARVVTKPIAALELAGALEAAADEIERLRNRYERPRTAHACDIPGCASCGNPEQTCSVCGNWLDEDWVCAACRGDEE